MHIPEPLKTEYVAPRQQRLAPDWNRIAAVMAWLGGCFTTVLFFASLVPDMPWLLSLAVAAPVQWILTMAERPLWRYVMRRRAGRVSVLPLVVTLLDGVVNAAGIYPQAHRLAQSGVGTMLAEVIGVQPAMDVKSAFLVSLALGLIIAALPEALWEYNERG